MKSAVSRCGVGYQVSSCEECASTSPIAIKIYHVNNLHLRSDQMRRTLVIIVLATIGAMIVYLAHPVHGGGRLPDKCCFPRRVKCDGGPEALACDDCTVRTSQYENCGKGTCVGTPCLCFGGCVTGPGARSDTCKRLVCNWLVNGLRKGAMDLWNKRPDWTKFKG